jgi:hypothetical protein
MVIRDILNEFNFKEISENEFQNGNWFVRLDEWDGSSFEIFSDPEIDRRYYYGSVNKLKDYLEEIKGLL